MELVFLVLLLVIMAGALASGYPVAFALPGAAILSMLLAAGSGYLFAGDSGAYFAHGSAQEWLAAGVLNFRGVYWEVERDTLIAIPLFVFMGIMLQRSKIAEDLLLTMAQLFGPIPGGLGISVVFVGALLAATTGILGATVVAMGLISLPAMLRNNYSSPLATGTIAASGTLGQIIPPSIVLIILADQLSSAVDQAETARKALYKSATGEISMPSEFSVVSTSAGDMFLGAMVPGLVLVGLYMLFILVIGLIKPSWAPAVPFGQKMDTRLLGKVLLILVPPLTLIFAVLGSIIAGIATVNQAGAIGAIGATIMAGYRLREGERGAFIPVALAVLSLVAIAIITNLYDLNVRDIQTDAQMNAIYMAAAAVAVFLFSVAWSLWRTFIIDDTLNGVMLDTAKTTSLVFIILLGAAMLTSAFRAFGGEELVKDFLTSLPGGFWMQFIIVMGVIFVLGFFLDFIEIAVVVVPIVAPILLMDPGANITAVWLGVMIGLNIQTSFLTPPFGFALFYLRGVAPKAVRTIDIYKGVVPFIGLQLMALVIVGNTPWLVNYLPERLRQTSETAPPPTNPALQYCVEQYLSEEFIERGDDLRAVIAEARNLPVDLLPSGDAKDLAASFDLAEKSFPLLDDVNATHAAVIDAAVEYRPILVEVRRLERDARKLDAHMDDLSKTLTRLRSTAPDSPAIPRIEAEIAAELVERDALLAQIPEDWPDRTKTFGELTKAEVNARRTFRRNSDDAFAPISDLNEILSATEDLAALEGDLTAIRGDVATGDPVALVERIEELRSAMRAAEASKATVKGLSEARKALRRNPDPVKAAEELVNSIAALTEELVWRRAAAQDLAPGLAKYFEALSGTIGLRQQTRLPREQALYVAACNSGHRDISLNF
ncbi:MAG: TRAP transporter large permease subunit [Pseudomonadota bacterium]